MRYNKPPVFQFEIKYPVTATKVTVAFVAATGQVERDTPTTTYIIV